eukprot:442381-Amphidinium_carterae.1
MFLGKWDLPLTYQEAVDQFTTTSYLTEATLPSPFTAVHVDCSSACLHDQPRKFEALDFEGFPITPHRQVRRIHADKARELNSEFLETFLTHYHQVLHTHTKGYDPQADGTTERGRFTQGPLELCSPVCCPILALLCHSLCVATQAMVTPLWVHGSRFESNLVNRFTQAEAAEQLAYNTGHSWHATGLTRATVLQTEPGQSRRQFGVQSLSLRNELAESLRHLAMEFLLLLLGDRGYGLAGKKGVKLLLFGLDPFFPRGA